MADREKPLRKMAEAFLDLSKSISSQSAEESHQQLEVGAFSRACSLVSPLFACLGIAFKFAKHDYVAKVDDLVEASKSIATIRAMIDIDIEANCVRSIGSHTRNLLRVKRGIDMVKVLFDQIMASGENSLKGPASTAYAQVFAPHHGRVIKLAVAAGMYALPTKDELLKKLNEDDEESAMIHMRSYVASSAPVIAYIDNLFLSKGLDINW
ncbi:unnamed protein product [Cuscuta epithymum]|uniref:Glycolipid transfer protein domain-containing protein n=1 Tax=Cuscuta epithymum TaxID=186058 RepID=A0AAV0FZV2_9ASTE|nr:unnamed protein product [Cuscuta epithymum]